MIALHVAPFRPKPCCTRTSDTRTVHAIERFRSADGVVIGIPVYKAAYSGMLKALLDLLPRCALEGVTVLPLAIGGSTCHALAIDYGLHPVFTSMGPAHIAPGWFVLDKHIDVREEAGSSWSPSRGRHVSGSPISSPPRLACGSGGSCVSDPLVREKPLTRWANRHWSRGLR
ncbi:NAD(P)H-dependent oxidoreductase [Streptomyces sp. NPDC048751]|uniref:NAD(P)H-dependent oxidoreductase n=1 Tax=Streptomyces sp. NPDC048751 TaxID=3365591 RepID=UPI00371EC189